MLLIASPQFASRFVRSTIESTPVIPDVTRPDELELVQIRLARKRRDAIAAIGDKWILHPDYVFNPRHSFLPEVWKQVPGFLDQVRSRAIAAGRL